MTQRAPSQGSFDPPVAEDFPMQLSPPSWQLPENRHRNGPTGSSVTLDDDLLAEDLLGNAARFEALFVCTEHEDCRGNAKLALECLVDTGKIPGETMRHLRRHFAALQLQTSHKIHELRDHAAEETQEERRIEVNEPFLIRAIVRRDVGPIRLMMQGRLVPVETEGRAHLVYPGILVVPGMIVHVRPAHAEVFGRRVSPREAIQWYGDHAGGFGQHDAFRVSQPMLEQLVSATAHQEAMRVRPYLRGVEEAFLALDERYHFHSGRLNVPAPDSAEHAAFTGRPDTDGNTGENP
jgi:hypothetical protein